MAINSNFCIGATNPMNSTANVITEYGKQNIFAKEVRTQLVDNYEGYSEEAEKANGRWAMIGMIAMIGAYTVTGQVLPGIF